MAETAYLIDRDGVLIYAKDGRPVNGALEWMKRLAEKGNPFLIATNHTTSSPEEGAADLRSMGFPVESRHMHTPLSILFQYFEERAPGRIYARGAPALLDYLHSRNLELHDGPEVNTVLLGFDQEMTYEALTTAISAVLDHGAAVIALHENRIYRDASGNVEPGLGAWVRALEYAANCEALVVGKPSGHYYRTGMERMGSQPGNTIMISDDPLGDLFGAVKAGLHTVFVTSGKYPDTDVLSQLEPDLRPDKILKSIADVEL